MKERIMTAETCTFSDMLNTRLLYHRFKYKRTSIASDNAQTRKESIQNEN